MVFGGCSSEVPVNDSLTSTSEIVVNSSLPNSINQTVVSKPDYISEDGEYFWENASVYEIINPEESKDLLNADEAVSLLSSKGFGSFPITYEYSVQGEYQGKVSVADHSEEKSPMYQTYYISSNEEVWTIYVINGKTFAYPVSFNLQSSLPAELLISETEQLTSYDYSDNLFLIIVPNPDTTIVKTVKDINAETLDKLTIEEINKL